MNTTFEYGKTNQMFNFVNRIHYRFMYSLNTPPITGLKIQYILVKEHDYTTK